MVSISLCGGYCERQCTIGSLHNGSWWIWKCLQKLAFIFFCGKLWNQNLPLFLIYFWDKLDTTIYLSTHQVIWCTLLSILIPILFAGTMKIGKASARHIIFDILTAIVQPIILHHQLTVAKVVRMKLLRQKDLALSTNYHEICNRIKSKQEELSKQNRLQLSIETIFQLTGNVILLFYAYSLTRTSQGLAALFMEDKIIFMGISLSSKFVLGLLMAMNLASFINVHINGIVQGYSSNNKIAGKLMLLLSILCGSLVRILSITFYFSPTLGLLNLLHHYQGTNLMILISTY